MGVGRMLAISMILWTIFATMSHGYGILVYLAMQIAISGLFAFGFRKVEKAYGEVHDSSNSESIKRTT
jgi:hypothetical protein